MVRIVRLFIFSICLFYWFCFTDFVYYFFNSGIKEGESSETSSKPCKSGGGFHSYNCEEVKYIEQEMAKNKGKQIEDVDKVENDLKRAEDELYVIPDHLKVKKRNLEESSTQWTTGIAEVQLPIEYKLRNIEETEAAKKLLQEKRLAGRTKMRAGNALCQQETLIQMLNQMDLAE
ncbi:hypothetical protein MKW92_015392 [Papaver armeniacum]|nr:hypothetical protein MKW92_015392 [Papaver armeniacum]